MRTINARIKEYSSFVYIALLALYIIRLLASPYFPQLEFISYLLGIMAVIFLIISLPQLKGTVRVLIYLMFFSGTVMVYFFADGGVTAYLLGLQGMANILCVFMIIEFTGFPVSFMDLKPLFRPIFYAAKKPAVLFGLITVVAMLMGSVVNMAVIPLIYYSVWDSLKENGMGYPRYLGVALKRGMALSIFWTPIGIVMAIVQESTGVPWIQIVAATIPICAIAFILSVATESIYLNREGKRFCDNTDRKKPPIGKEFWVNLKFLVGYVFFLMTFVLVLNRYINMTDTLIITSMIIPPLWALLAGKEQVFLQQAKKHFKLKVPELGEPFSLFIAAGIFTAGLQAYGFESLLNNYLLLALEIVGVVGILMLIILAMMLTSWLGLHPLVFLILISQSIDFNSGVIPPLYYATALLTGVAVSNLTSPVTTATLVTAGILNKKSVEVGIKWNFVYVSMFLVVLPVVLRVRLLFAR